MIRCDACLAEVPEGSRYCPACGAALPTTLQPTAPYRAEPATEDRPLAETARPPVAVLPEDQPRFATGTTLLGRYRIVSALGKGGMGEVYRAEDLRLRQPVALKFLPRDLLDDPDRLARLHKEVRIAREVSHPLVCRVHDIAEVDGEAFLIMEFIGGEDLDSLLRRIGRLPEDKGVELARQLSEGLAAVHEKGIVHRDLKPRNIMIDGRGQVRLTDFGLAAHAGSIPPADFRSGTPAYMAPEQLAGGLATEQSDLFALGLVLYEMFTGRRPFPARNREELARLYAEHAPEAVSRLVPGIDLNVARVIRQCLERDPARRPRSALAVAALLPKPDPLATALAGGRTPSPEVVANAGAEGTLSPPLATALLAAAVLGIAAVAFLARHATLTGRVPFDRSPRALAARARTVLDRLGCDDLPADTRHGLYYNYDYLNHVARTDPGPGRWAALPTGEPPAVGFWLRQSPQYLVAFDLGPRVYPGRVTPSDPPAVVPGMATVFLDTAGRLIEFSRVPGRELSEPGPTAGVDWKPLFEEARLDPARAGRCAPKWAPPFFADESAAWEIPRPDGQGEPVRVEAAACRGRAVYFKVFHGRWDRPNLLYEPLPPESSPFRYLYAAVFCLVLAGAALLARRNLHRGLGDPAGASRLAGFQFACHLACMALIADHVPSFQAEAGWLMRALGYAGLWSALCWLLYVSLEPYVRRRWPWRMVSWNRLLAGRFRDPMVGRDLLIGALLGIFLTLMFQLGVVLPSLFGRAAPLPLLVWPSSFTDVPYHLVMELPLALKDALQWFFLMFLLVLFLRREWLAVPLVFALMLAYYLLQEPELNVFWVALMGAALTASTIVALRFGLLAMIVGLYFCYFLYQVPLTLDFTVWYGWQSFVYLLWAVTLCGVGYLLARGGPAPFAEVSPAESGSTSR
jgi:serine/threonine-protein kinase